MLPRGFNNATKKKQTGNKKKENKGGETTSTKFSNRVTKPIRKNLDERRVSKRLTGAEKIQQFHTDIQQFNPQLTPQEDEKNTKNPRRRESACRVRT